jgi:hypothetical protein
MLFWVHQSVPDTLPVQARKLARKPHPLKSLLDQKRPESFMGLGVGDPLVGG